jgi:hypothetical protein
MGDTLSKERQNNLTSCLRGEEKEIDECGFRPFPKIKRPRQDIIYLEYLSLTANSLNYDSLNKAKAMNLDPPYLVQKKIMVGTLLFAYNDLCNKVTVPFSEEPLFSHLEKLITTQKMELLSLKTSALRPSTPRPSHPQDSIISIIPGGMALPGHTLPMEIRVQIH